MGAFGKQMELLYSAIKLLLMITQLNNSGLVILLIFQT